MVDPEELGIKPFRQTVHEYSGYQSLTDVPKTLIFNEKMSDYKVIFSPVYTTKVYLF